MVNEWDYTAVAVTDDGLGLERATHDLVSRLAPQGWRVLAVVNRPGLYGGGTWAYFKRATEALAA